jgi:2-polyprenyl-3-methyl-5-hydroxy-6-metoxy-1,4-benzoquinol methylase
MNMLDNVCKELNNMELRVVDIGCGPGLLAKNVKSRDLKYLGIDNDLNCIRYCQEIYFGETGIEFATYDCEADRLQFSTNDIIILNGIVHHLNNFQLSALLKKAQVSAALIICDHLKEERNLTLKQLIPFILQFLDRGKFIRLYTYFENMEDWAIKRSEKFPINLACITLWDYFCNYYVVKDKH